MADDKPTLTRRRVLGGMATIGVAGALGAGTWAQMRDTENGNVTLTAGTLDLVVGEGGEPFEFDIGPVRNGENYTNRAFLRNTGNIEGTHLSITYPTEFGDMENTILEPEADAGDTSADDGELVQYLNTRVWVEQENGSVVREFFFSQKDLVPLADVEAETFYIELPRPIPGGSDCELHVQHKVDEEDISDAMGDSVSYELDVTLYDTDPRP